MIALTSIRDCFEGVIPSVVATLDAEGVPNVSYLSQVYLIDDDHVALSNQFFSKTADNVRATGRATIIVVSGRSGIQYRLDLVHEASLTTGDLFDRMAAQLSAIGTQQGAGEIMKLRSAELYRVEACRPLAGPTDAAPAAPATPHPKADERLAQAARLSAAIGAESDADAMVDRTLEGLISDFGFSNAMVLAVDPAEGRLTTLASRGYPIGGAGSEVAPGEGVIGIAASSGRPVRLSDMSRGRRMAAAVRASARIDADRYIPLPGLAEPQSQLAAPMISRGKTYGVLFTESPERFRFGPDDEAALTLIGGQLVASLRLADMEAGELPPERPGDLQPLPGAPFRVKLFAYDDSLFIDETYVIKGVPGRLLFHFLRIYAESGRCDFTNREVRLESTLRLPDLKDNLETRLILLRRRLDERRMPVRLSRPRRGQIRLEVEGSPQLELIDK
ncbi:GAF domain-containing protein [Brevundimonas sp.]|uniref:GAF domain-containing protein n=1 Tax=Brevundimonas sp. TaxID=1871086 RepID=UPI002FC7E318